MKKFLLLFLTCFLTFAAAKAQVIYTQGSCAYTPIAGSGTPLTSGDDIVTSNVPIGFNFNFFGTNYSTCHVSTNGFLSFNGGIGSGCCSGQSMPNAPTATTIVAWAWDDMYTVGTTQYDYLTVGVAPNRIFIINYNNIGYCCSAANQATVQIQLYETTGEIRILSANNDHSGRTSTMGIQDGASAYTVAGRNAASWISPANECISFTPVPPTPPTITSFAPASGCAGTASVVITGTNFLGASAVTFGGVPALSYTVNSATQITAVPAVAGSTGTIAVTTVGGTVNSASTFTVNPLPSVVASATPTSLCAGGSSSLSMTSNVSPLVTVFTENFANNSQGWTLGTEWAIGSATASSGQSYGNADPSVDATPTADNGVAGVVIGGNASTPIHAPYYITSPVINLSGLPNATLNFQRFLNSDYTPFMQNYIDVWNGSAWVNIWVSGPSPAVVDATWTPQTFNITPYMNANFQVRFGHDVGASGVFTVSSWNIDDVTITSTQTVSYAWTGPATIATPAAQTTSVTPGANGSQVYTATVTDGNGCIGTATTSVLVEPVPTATITQSPVNPLACGVNPTLTAPLGLVVPPAGARYYIRDNDPWSTGNNTTAMDAVFGAGNYFTTTFAAATPASVFVPSTQFVFLEGSDNNYTSFNAYIAANIATIENWVNAGGRLFMNNGPQGGGTVNWGFGGVVNTYPNFIGTTTGIVPAHPIFNGPYTPSGVGPYTGNSYAHAAVSGGGITPLMTDGGSLTVFAEKTWGSGLVFFGGATSPNFHAPSPNAQNLWQNIISYTATSAQGAALNYTWAPGGAITQSITATTSGIYTVTVTQGGCSSTATLSVTLNPNPTVTANASALNICAGSPLTLTGGGATTYTWTDGVNTPTDGTSFIPASTATYTVTGTNASGCTATSTVTVTVDPTPTVVATATPSSICVGSSSSLGATGADIYTWNPGSLSGASVSVSPVTSTTYTVTGSSLAGCTATSTVSVTVNSFNAGIPNPELLYYKFDGAGTSVPNQALTPPPGTATATILGGITQGSTGQTGGALVGSGLAASTDYLNTGYAPNLGGGSWTISFWSEGISTNATLYYIFGDANTASFRCFTNGVAGAGNWILRGAGLTDITIPGGAQLTPTLNTYVYDATLNNVKGYLNGVLVSTVAQTAPNLTGAGPLKVMGYSSNVGAPSGGKLDEFRLYNRALTPTEVMQLLTPGSLFSATASPTTVCAGSTVTLTGAGANSYSWDPGLIAGSPATVNPTSTTAYTLTGTDANGCTGTSSVTVTVTPASGTIAPATSNQSQSHNDDFNINYSDASCNLIATVDDGAGGNILGLTTATVNVEATAGIHNGQPFVRRWYQITPTSNGSADVILYINQADFNDYNASVTAPYLPLPTSGNNADPNIANIRITKNSDAGLGNSPVVITPTVNWNGTYWELSFNTPSFSQFRVHSVNPGNAPLPATVTNFSGRKMSTSDMLEWTTASEQNNAYFNLQHGTDGINFTTIAKVNSQAPNGNSSSILNYSFENTKPQLGHNYYRLQQVDIDNHSTMNAKVVDIIWGTNGSTVSIYPNPTVDVLNIDLYTSKVQNTTVKVLDMSGRIVKQIQGRSEAGMNKLSISLGEIASGVYTVQVFENDNLTHVSKVKKND